MMRLKNAQILSEHQISLKNMSSFHFMSNMFEQVIKMENSEDLNLQLLISEKCRFIANF